jgi:hypothetical protein
MSDDPILSAEANRPIQRRRVFIASSANTSTSPAEAAPEIVSDSVSQDAMDEEDGLPLLTEVITGPLPVAASFTQAQLDAVHQELARWLAEELPEAVLKVTDGVADQLVKELTCQAEKQLLPCLLAHLAPHH